MGGSVPIDEEIVISTKKMNKILGFDETTGVVFAEAGCILEDLQNYVAQYDFMMPLDLGAKGSC